MHIFRVGAVIDLLCSTPVGVWIVFPGVPAWLEIVLLILLSIFLYVFVFAKIVRRYWKFPAPAFIGRALNSNYRKRIQPPSMIIQALELESGMKVVEIGCGPGTFTIDVAKAIQPDGIVYAVDIQEEMLEQLQSNMLKHNVGNIVPVLADAGGRMPIEDDYADAVFGVTVLPEISNKTAALNEIKRILKPGGLFADAELAIDPDWPLRRTVKRWVKEVGLVFKSQHGHALRYVLVFNKE
ncbi:MAG: class I SAM-dependent methyltransferase [Candidatus Thorarchaeota archaeon]